MIHIKINIGAQKITNKKIYFLSGFPRSGSTVLSSILNQHDDIHSGNQSSLILMMTIIENGFFQCEEYLSGNSHNRYNNLLNKAPYIFYEDINKEVIIDKHRAWGSKESLKYLNIIDQNFKIIYTHRSIVEILSSMIIINRKYPDNVFIKQFLNSVNKDIYDFSMEDEYCDFYFNNFLIPCIEVFNHLSQDKYRNNVIFIDYKDLIDCPEKKILEIYNFLNVKNYKNDLNNIEGIKDYSSDYFKASLHEIRSSISESKNNPKEILSKNIFEKYNKINLKDYQ